MKDNHIEIFECEKCGRVIKAKPPIVCNCSQQFQIKINKIGYSKMDNQENNTTQSPNIIQKAQNFGAAVIRHAQNKMILVANNIKDERMSICSGCEFYNTTNANNPTCNKCGCFLKIKTGWASEKCPIGKWSDIKTQSSGGCGCNKKQNNQ